MSIHLKPPNGITIPLRPDNNTRRRSVSSILEKFPRGIMKKICLNLPTKSIINLSLTSHTVHGKCHGFIYGDLKIVDTRVETLDPDELVIQNHFMTFKDEALEMDHWWIHIHETQIKLFKPLLLMIYNILQDESLGSEVDSIKIESRLKPNPFERCEIDRCVWESTLEDVLDEDELQLIVQLGLGSIHLTLFQCLNMLISKCSNLQRLWVPYFPLRNVELLLGCPFPQLVEFKMMIYSNDDYYKQLDFTNLTSLKKLRIMFQEDTEVQLASLAKGLSRSIAGQLTELQMKYDKTDFNYLTKPTWMAFFSNLTTPLVDLRRLKLKHCFFDDKQQEILRELTPLIPFGQLEWLSLQIYEHSHKGEPCGLSETTPTVLMQLAPQLHSLKELWVKGSNDCPGCQFRSLVQSLKQFKQLDQLIIFTNTATANNYRGLLRTISGMKIRELGIFDEFINTKLIQLFKSHFLLEAGVRFDTFKNYLVETKRQERNTMFHGYIMDSFNEFNNGEFEMICSFWIKYLPLLGLVDIIRQCAEVKLFGYNFKCDVNRKVIMLYQSNDHGFKDLMYY